MHDPKDGKQISLVGTLQTYQIQNLELNNVEPGHVLGSV